MPSIVMKTEGDIGGELYVKANIIEWEKVFYNNLIWKLGQKSASGRDFEKYISVKLDVNHISIEACHTYFTRQLMDIDGK